MNHPNPTPTTGSFYECKVPGCNFVSTSRKGLHIHIKSHNITQAKYYTTYYPRFNKLNGNPIEYKDFDQYFNNDFRTVREMNTWLKQASEIEASEYILNKIKNRIESKSLAYAPCHNELAIYQLPGIEFIKKFFGSYTNLCKNFGVKPIYGKGLNYQKLRQSKIQSSNILVDTREQKPLEFPNSEIQKLDFGDYTLSGKQYNYTYVDRKSEPDFKSSLTGKDGCNFNRLRRELKKAQECDSYLYIVVESDKNKIYRNHQFGKANHKASLDFIYHNMRILSHEFPNNCQFVFSGSRENSQLLIPFLLTYGKSLWGVDVQYYIDKQDLISVIEQSYNINTRI